MVFPWADGNLQDFWEKTNLQPENCPRNSSLALWHAIQFLGMAEGLRLIHNPNTSDASTQTDVLREFGRHGDLKPENILWFSDHKVDDAACQNGILKIADFGLADFHSKHSRSKVPNKTVGRSPTHRAPEADAGEHVSPMYDVWSLGCILLQFSTWYLQGWKGVDEFASKLLKESRKRHGDPDLGVLREDNFFNTINRGDKVEAITKPSVAEVGSPLEGAPCRGYLHPISMR